MKRYNINGFYGEYGKLEIAGDGTAHVEIIMNGGKINREYKGERSAKIAISKLLDIYELKEMM